MAKARLYYATDTYCVWCFGFGPAVRAFAAANADRAWVDVVPGGLLVGDRVVPVGEKTRVRETAARVAQLCGVTFGQGFADAVDDGGIVLDSVVAARALVSLRDLTGLERGLEVAHLLQDAWYVDGLDLHDEAVIRRIAVDLGVDPDEALRQIADPASEAQALAEFERRKALGIKGYPTLLLETSDGLGQVGGPTSSAERLTACFEALLAGVELPSEPDDDRE